ncbi:MAG: 6-phosphogluconolactonase [Actinomycetota bacterium]
MERHVYRSPDELAGAAAGIIATEIEDNDEVLLGLAGGSTPRMMYQDLAAAPIDWSGVTAWMTDERWVGPDDSDSNQRMVRESLGTSGHIRFLAPNTRLKYPTAAAARMTRAMRCLMNRRPNRAVTVLGLGDDGHTASLFPATDALAVREESFVANWVPQLDSWRLTASFDLLGASDVVVFLVSGAGKAAAIAEIAAGSDLPAARITARERVVWLLDEEAAERL